MLDELRFETGDSAVEVSCAMDCDRRQIDCKDIPIRNFKAFFMENFA